MRQEPRQRQSFLDSAAEPGPILWSAVRLHATPAISRFGSVLPPNIPNAAATATQRRWCPGLQAGRREKIDPRRTFSPVILFVYSFIIYCSHPRYAVTGLTPPRAHDSEVWVIFNLEPARRGCCRFYAAVCHRRGVGCTDFAGERGRRRVGGRGP